MPYGKSDVPQGTKDLPPHGQAIYKAAYNSAHQQYNGNEAKAHATAWQAVKKKFKKKGDSWVYKKDWSGVMRTVAHDGDEPGHPFRGNQYGEGGGGGETEKPSEGPSNKLYPHADLSAAKLESAYKKQGEENSRLNSEMIAAGRGYEKPSETRQKSDPLSQKVNAASSKHNALVTEMRRRERFHGGHKPLPAAHRQSFSDGDQAMRAIDKEFSIERRKELAKSGKATKSGSYPIESEQDLKNAIQAFGRAKNKAVVKAHIKQRAKALGLTKLIPENWDSVPAAKKQIYDAWMGTRDGSVCPECKGSGVNEDKDDECDTCGGDGYVGLPASLENDRKPPKDDDEDEDEDDDDEDMEDQDEDMEDSKSRIQFTDKFVLDSTGMRKTSAGYLVANARIARTGVQLYDGAELGAPHMQVVRVYRPPEEVFSKKSMSSMAHKPITVEHPPHPVDSKNWKDYSVGQTGDDVARDGDCVRVPMVIMDAKAVDAVEKHGVRELSVGYSTDLKWGQGLTPSGEVYDAKQTAIRGNHLAVVPAARGGSLLRIGDDKGGSEMVKLLIDGHGIDFADELAAKHVQNYIAKLQADAKKKKNGNGDDDEEDEDMEDDAAEEEQAREKKTRAEKDALSGEIIVLKKQLDDALAANKGSARAKAIKDSIELLMKANAAMGGKLNLDDCLAKSDAEIHRIVCAAHLGDEVAKSLSDEQSAGAFRAITAKVKVGGSGVDRLADSLNQLAMGGSGDRSPKAIKDAAYSEYVNNIGNAWKTQRAS